MKLDKDLVRLILLAVEADGEPRGWVKIDLPDFSHEQIAYHIEILAEAAFLEATDLSSMSHYDWRATRLTYRGHEFLDTIRDPEIWIETKKIATKLGAGSVSMLFEVGKAYLKQKLTEHGAHLS